MTEIVADLSAVIWKILVEKGQTVAEDQTVVILEAMKMEFPIDSPVAGVVAEVHVRAGDAVNEGDVLVSVS